LTLYRLRRHPLAVAAHFRHSLVLAYAFPPEALEPLLAPGLELDTHEGHAFAAVAMVQTEQLRPAGLPRALGLDFFLCGYRLFVRVRERQSLRGLQILRSDTDRRTLAISGNLLTHYRWHVVDVTMAETGRRVEIEARTPRGESDLRVRADLAAPAALPAGSPFAGLDTARRFAGPLPYTFDYEPQSRSLVAVRGVRSGWEPQPVAVEVERVAYLERPPFDGRGILANAFHVADVDYRWGRGRLFGVESPH